MKQYLFFHIVHEVVKCCHIVKESALVHSGPVRPRPSKVVGGVDAVGQPYFHS